VRAAAKKKPKKQAGKSKGQQGELVKLALAMPGATEHFPWGERVVKVGGKVFVFLGRDEERDGVGMSVKLPESSRAALTLPFCQPTGYGLGKAGWVSVSFKGKQAPLDLLRQWLLESYRAVAPKKFLKQLDAP
jgi:predicted DNA-binding protein (MmcQ/YjbR family)